MSNTLVHQQVVCHCPVLVVGEWVVAVGILPVYKTGIDEGAARLSVLEEVAHVVADNVKCTLLV